MKHFSIFTLLLFSISFLLFYMLFSSTIYGFNAWVKALGYGVRTAEVQGRYSLDTELVWGSMGVDMRQLGSSKQGREG
jgi:uncharacterized membrane protein